tara:strand:+ start:10231 stop:12165 length:1935 start_codon:yes stop_codon:yes gene_type:complete
MAFSVSPSVIVREVDASQAVPAIATPPAAIAGVFRWGPTNEPILLSSENQLVDRFGAPDAATYETFFVAADFLSYSNALYVVRADDGSLTASGDDLVLDGNNAVIEGSSTYGAFAAKYQGALGNSIEVAWVSSAGFENSVLAAGDIPTNKVSNNQIDQTISFNSANVQFEVGNTAQLAALSMGDVLVIGNQSIGYQELKIATFTETAGTVTEGEGNNAVTYVESYAYDITFSNKYTLAETDLFKLSMTRKWQHNGNFSRKPDVGHIHVAVIDKLGTISGTPYFMLEKFENVSTTAGAVTAQGTTNYYPTVIDNFSSWVKIANTAVIGTAATALSRYENMAGGTDATTETTATLAHIGFALDTLKNANEIDISFVLQGKGDDDATRANYIVSNVCETRKDCVAFLSPSKEAVVDELKMNAKLANVIAYRNKLQPSSYSFIDSGYKYRYDKYNDVYRWTPLNGDMAGLAARVEPWESPAGFRKGVIKNVVKLAFNPDKTMRDVLYGSDVNPVISQTGQGIVLFGDKTGLGLTSAFDRLNVRRLFIAVEKAIATAAASFLFELNDDFTQTQFKNIVDPFLRDIQGRRGIIDYRVISDSTVNTPEVIDQNKFRASIFIKPARSINVIELTFVATRTGIEFDEIVGQLT